MSKEVNMKDVLSEAKKEIFEGKSATVKGHLQSLIGKSDGIRARMAVTIEKMQKELDAAEDEIARFTSLTVDEAFNEIMAKRNSGIPILGTLNSSLGNCFDSSIR